VSCFLVWPSRTVPQFALYTLTNSNVLKETVCNVKQCRNIHFFQFTMIVSPFDCMSCMLRCWLLWPLLSAPAYQYIFKLNITLRLKLPTDICNNRNSGFHGLAKSFTKNSYRIQIDWALGSLRCFRLVHDSQRVSQFFFHIQARDDTMNVW
jgi:hypothetical protein